MSKSLVQYVKSGLVSISHSVVLALPLASALLSTSCLIGPPDAIAQVERVPPRVIDELTVPTDLAYVTSTSTEDLVFHVEFVSEDLGEDVVARLYLNLDTVDESLIISGSAGPGSLNDDQPRALNLTWFKNRSAQEAAGCYTITMTIGHEDAFSKDGILKPLPGGKAAYVTWWVAHNIAPQDLTFDSCPSPGPDLP